MTGEKPRRTNPLWLLLAGVAWVFGWAADKAMRREGGFQ